MSGTEALTQSRVEKLKDKDVRKDDMIEVLRFSLDILNETTVADRNSAAHPIRDIVSLLEWEILSLPRLPTLAERRSKADALHIMCVCATAAPYHAQTIGVRDMLERMRQELGLGRFEDRHDDSGWSQTCGKSSRPFSSEDWKRWFPGQSAE